MPDPISLESGIKLNGRRDRREENRQYYQRNRIRIRNHQNSRRAIYRSPDQHLSKVLDGTIRDEVLQHYGNGIQACVICSYAGPALQLDHINDDGAQHRKETGRRGWGMYAWLLKSGLPVGYQTLCANCNWEKELAKRDAKTKERLHVK